MYLKHWNEEQLELALDHVSRNEYWNETHKPNPTHTELILFYIEHHAKEFSDEHQLTFDFMGGDGV